MTKETPNAELQATFARVSRNLLEDQALPAETGRMLRSAGLRTAGRFFAFTTDDALVVKLPEARVNELIGSGAGRPCQLGRARPMREWVRLAPADEATFAAYVIEARDFVAGLADPASRPRRT